MPERGGRSITLLDLATHTSGLPPEPSNLGAGLLGHVLARRAGMDYETLVRARITGPFGMSSTGITLPSTMGYEGRYQLAPAVILTVRRQGNRFVTQFTGEPPFELFAESEKDYFLKAADAQFTFASDGTGKVTAVLLRLSGAAQTAPRIERAPVMPREITVDPVVLERYVGRYEFAPHLVLEISRKDRRMFAQLTGQPPIEIFATSAQQFSCTAVNAQLTFETGEEGRVLAVVLHQNGVDQRARRIDD